MRRLMLLMSLSGCSLYFNTHDGVGDDRVDAGDPDLHPLPDAAAPVAMVRCEDGTLREVHVEEYAVDLPTHGAGDLVGHCAGGTGCASAAYACLGGDCDGAYDALCNAPPSTGEACALAGTACSASDPIACPQSTKFGPAVPRGTCTCGAGGMSCAPGPGVAALQQQLVGKWQGTVTSPFAAPYTVSVWIYPDGSYWAECDPDSDDANGRCTAFYYGGDGPKPLRKLAILATDNDNGAYADIAIDFATASPNIGAIQSLSVSDTALQFTFFASWNGCTQPIVFSLTRVASSV